MGSTKVIFLFVLLAAASAKAKFHTRCPSEQSNCYNQARVTIDQRGIGSCKSTSTSICNAFAQMVQCVTGPIPHLFNPTKCRGNRPSVDAACLARTTAQTVAVAYSEVLCSGRRTYTCTSASTDADALACSLIRPLALYSQQQGRGYNARCDQALGRVVKEIVKAMSSARSEVCKANKQAVLKFDKEYDWDHSVRHEFERAWNICFSYCGVTTKPTPPRPHGPPSPGIPKPHDIFALLG